MNSGWSSFSNPAGRNSGLSPFQFGLPRVTAVMSTIVGPSPSDGANGRYGNIGR